MSTTFQGLNSVIKCGLCLSLGRKLNLSTKFYQDQFGGLVWKGNKQTDTLRIYNIKWIRSLNDFKMTGKKNPKSQWIIATDS